MSEPIRDRMEERFEEFLAEHSFVSMSNGARILLMETFKCGYLSGGLDVTEDCKRIVDLKLCQSSSK